MSFAAPKYLKVCHQNSSWQILLFCSFMEGKLALLFLFHGKTTFICLYSKLSIPPFFFLEALLVLKGFQDVQMKMSANEICGARN